MIIIMYNKKNDNDNSNDSVDQIRIVHSYCVYLLITSTIPVIFH